MLKHLLTIAGITVFVVLLYHRIPKTYFCGYDDFNEIHRAAFEETREPLRILTATHFNTYKYRPLSHGLHFITHKLSNGGATLFRVRNVLCHLINIALVYAIGLLLFNRQLTSGVAALLFGVHPLVNQPVVAASFTIPAAHVGFLLSLFCFLFSLRRRGSVVWLCLALLSGGLSIFVYESSLSVFVLMFAYLFIHFAATRKIPVNRTFLLTLTGGTLLLVGSYFGLRLLFVSVGAQQAIPSVQTMAKASLMYACALLSPIDSVMANQWFGAPLPSEIELSSMSKLWLVLFVCGAAAAAAIVVLLRKPLARRLRAPDWPNLLFLLIAIIVSVLPFIVLTLKPSETYLYMSVAFAALLFSSLLEALVVGTGRTSWGLYATVVGVLTLSFSCATWVRNNQVVRCGDTVERIVPGLRADKLKEGVWSIWLAAVPGEPTSRRYGIYGWRGVDTIGEQGMHSAVQWLNNNESLKATVVGPEFLERNCKGSREVCLWVHEDGRVVEAGH